MPHSPKFLSRATQPLRLGLIIVLNNFIVTVMPCISLKHLCAKQTKSVKRNAKKLLTFLLCCWCLWWNLSLALLNLFLLLDGSSASARKILILKKTEYSRNLALGISIYVHIHRIKVKWCEHLWHVLSWNKKVLFCLIQHNKSRHISVQIAVRTSHGFPNFQK